MANHTTISKPKTPIRQKKAFYLGVTLLICSLLVGLLALFAPKLSTFSKGNITQIESKLQSKLGDLDAIANRWLTTKDTTQSAAFSILDDKEISKLNRDNLSVFFTVNQRIIAWSTVPNFADTVALKTTPKPKLYLFNDGWYIVKQLHGKGKSAILCIRIQSNYRFTNKFLENTFNPIFDIPDNYRISSKPEESLGKPRSYQVNVGGEPAFALIRESVSPISNPTKDILFFCSLILLILGGWTTLQAVSFGRRARLFFSTLIVWNALCIALINWIGTYPSNLLIFSAELYSSAFAPSLAHLSLYSLVLISFCSSIYSHYVDYRIKSKKLVPFLALLLAILLAAIAAAIYTLTSSLVNEADISFGVIKISEISRYSLLVYAIISLATASFILLSNLFFRLFRDITMLQKALLLLAPLAATYFLLFKNETDYLFTLASAVAVYALYLFRLKAYQRIGIRDISLIMVIWAIGSSAAICHLVVLKDEANRIRFAESLYNEKDPILEAALPELTQQVVKDATIRKLILNPSANDSVIYQRIKREYLRGYLSKYNLIITICPVKANLFLPNEKKTTSCKEYFDNLFLHRGTRIPKSAFYFVRNFPGEISYIGQIDYLHSTGQSSLYIEFDVKTITNNPGYPELLLKKDAQLNKGYKEYEYAHYMDSSLMAKNGAYPYPSIITPPTLEDSIVVREAKGYSNLFYRFDDHNTMVISRPILRFFDIASCFSYLFIFLAITGLLVLKRSRFPLDETLSFASFKGRITLSFVLILTVALILTAVASLAYGIKRFEAYKEQTIQDKMKSAIPAVYNALFSPSTESLTSELVRISNYLYVDVNLYDRNGELFATSRPEIFYDGLQGFKMPPRAFKSLVIGYDGFYVDNESIGNMSYTSSYAPISDNNGKLIGYVNLPYFLQYDNLRKELYTIAVATANIFILLLLPVIFIAVLISNSITRPLAQVRNRMRTFDLKTNPEPIPYPKNDEIGDLIVEFNKMINQVEESAQKLAHSERDTAWREMARQIAHEIKNPLTPMKLSLQYLLMLKKANDARWLDQFDRFATSQVEQIDSLAKIANEFSNFAKISFDESIPPINLASVVEETIPIFDGYPNLNLEVNLNSSLAFVVADREHIKRVLVNLVKNATQAAENDSEVTVKISLQVSTNTALITVTDNGKGIKEEEKAKIFTPNFTTKTSGSGLGLAISKNLIEMYGGRIWFESVKNNGTSFYIELPIFISK